MLRTAIALALMLAAAAAAERESFTLRDGRTLVGVYDENAQAITLDGKAHAVLALRADQIASREPAPAIGTVVAEKPKPVAEPSPANEPHAPRGKTWDDALAEAQRIQDEADQRKTALYRKALIDLHLRRLPMPDVGADPRASEVKRDEQLRHSNALVDHVDAALAGERAYTPRMIIEDRQMRAMLDDYEHAAGFVP